MSSALYQYGGNVLRLAELAKELNCESNALISLALCRRPSQGDSDLLGQVNELAEKSGVQQTKILNILRCADAISRFQSMPDAYSEQLMLAARDRISFRIDSDEEPTG